jgi:hypothetical protein
MFKENNFTDKEDDFIDSIKGYKEFLGQKEARHINDVNAINPCVNMEISIKNYIQSIIKEYLITDTEEKFTVVMLVDFIYFNFSDQLASLWNIILGLDKNDLILSFRLNLKDTSLNEKKMLFFKFFNLHILSLCQIRREKVTKKQ